MFALIVAVSTLSFLPAPPPQDPATLLPPDTIFYSGTDSLRAGSQAAKKSAMHMIFNEPEVKAFLAKPLSILDRVLSQASEQQGFEKPPFTMSEFVLGEGEGPPIGRMFVALTHVSLDMESGESPDVGLVIGLEMLSDEDLGMVRGLWDMIPATQQESSYDGHAIFSKSPPGEDGFAARLTFLDNMAVASLSGRSLQAVIDRYSGKAVGGTLASSKQYQRLIEVAGGQHAGGSVSYMEPAAMAGLLRNGMAMAMMMEGESEMIPKVTGLIDSLGLEAFVGLGSASYRDREGLVHSTSVLFREPGATGLLPEIVGELQPLDLSRLEGMPGNSMAASGSAVPRLAALYDFIMNSVEMFEPGAAAKVRAEIEKVMPEEQFRNDLLDNVGGEFWSFSLANQGVMQIPASVYSLEAKDPDAFIAALTKIVGFIGKENNVDVAVVKVEGEGAEIYELDLSKTPLAVTMMAPGFAVKDGELMMSLESSDLLRQALEGKAGEGKLTEVPGFSEFVSGLKEKGDIVSVSFSDNAQVFESMYGQVTGMAQMFGGGLGSDIPVDLSLLPTEGSIKKHLRYSFSGQYKADDGRQVIAEARSQFDVSDFMPFLVMGAMFAVVGQTSDFNAMAEAEKDPAQQVNDDLGKIKAGLTIYRITNGGYPDALDQLVESHPDYPNGFLGSPELPADPWGNPYLFRMEGKKPVLWSAGPDGVDESGGGDDIVKGA